MGSARINTIRQRFAEIDDLVDKITDIAMKERRKEIIASPRAGSPEGQRYNEKKRESGRS